MQLITKKIEHPLFHSGLTNILVSIVDNTPDNKVLANTILIFIKDCDRSIDQQLGKSSVTASHFINNTYI